MVVNLSRDGKPSYKPDFNKAILEGKTGTEELGVLSVSNLKKEKKADSDYVLVNVTSKIPDRVIVAFTDKTDLVSLTDLARAYAKCYERYTKPYKDSKIKILSAPGKIDVECENNFLDEYISNADVAKVVVGLYQSYLSDGTFASDSDLAEGIVGQYFNFISYDDARALVMDIYKKEQERK